MKKFLTILVFLSVLNLANAGYESETNQGGWVYKDGTSVPNSDSMKSIKGFGGWLVVTPDADWEEKWNTPPDTTPNFTVASEVNYGEELTILPFYINPKLNSRGEANVLCDIKITRPDGSNAIDAKDIECASGKLQGNPRNVRLTSAVIRYMGEEGDPPGIWMVEIELTDTIRNVAVPLKTQFKLVK